MGLQWRVRVEIPLKPTEDEDRVLGLVDKIIAADRVYVEETGEFKTIVAEARCVSSLRKLHSLLRRERILDSARRRMLRSIAGETLVILLHKQALAVGRASLVDEESESPLGPVRVEIRHPNPREVVDWLAPATRRGRPLWEKEDVTSDCA